MAYHTSPSFGLNSNSFTPPARVDEDFIPVYLAHSKDEVGREASLKDAETPLENLAFDEPDVVQPAQDTMWAHQWRDLYPPSDPKRYCALRRPTASTAATTHVLLRPREGAELLDNLHTELSKSLLREMSDDELFDVTLLTAVGPIGHRPLTIPRAGPTQTEAVSGTKQHPILIDELASPFNKKRSAAEQDHSPRPLKAARQQSSMIPDVSLTKTEVHNAKSRASFSPLVQGRSSLAKRKRPAEDYDANPRPTKALREQASSASLVFPSPSQVSASPYPLSREPESRVLVPRPVTVVSPGVAPSSLTNGTTGLAQSNFSNRINNQENYGLGLKGRVPPDCQLPLNVDIGLREALTFFPNHVQIPELADRLMRNGIPIKQAAKMQLFAVDRVNKKDVQTVENRLKQQFSKAGKILYKNEIDDKPWEQSTAVKKGVQPDLTANSWKLRSQHAGHATNFHNFKLADIAKAVPRERWPKGNDALLITKCLEYAMDNPDEDWNTTHWHVLITMLRLQPPAAPANYTTRDHEALKRFREEVANPTK